MKTLAGRQRMDLVRAAVLGVLVDAQPRALCTSEVQAAFAPRDLQRVYNALRQLADRGLITWIHTVDRAWWAFGSPSCSMCGRDAARVATRFVTDGERWTTVAWFLCTGADHPAEVGSDGFRWWPDFTPPYDGPRI